METIKRLLQPVSAFATWNAPATALMLIKVHNALSEFHHAGVIVKHDDTSGAEKSTGLHQRVEVHGNVNFVGLQNRRARAAGHNRLQLAAVRNAASDFVDHLLQVVAERQLVYAGALNVSAHAEQPSATVLRRA